MTHVKGDWQLKCAVIKERGGEILESGSWADCKFIVGQITQAHFSAHKLILAMASPVFDAMFYGVIAEKDVIFIPDVAPEPFYAMLEYIYTDKIKLNSFDDASALYYCANKYMLPHLMEGCVKYLSGTLNTANVCQTYEFAKTFDEYELMDTCLQMIQSQTSEVLNNDSFVEAKLATIQDIFGLTPLSLENELELFKAAERYAQTNGNRNGDHNDGPKDHLKPDIDKSTDDLNQDIEKVADKYRENKSLHSQEGLDFQLQDPQRDEESQINEKIIFKSILDKILLLTLTPQQFAEGPARSSYITQAEAFAILMNIASTNTDISIPNGFNDQRNPRYKLIADPANNQDLGLDQSKARSQTVFRFTLPDFRKTKHMSMPFVVRKLSWRIAINPKHDKSLDKEFLGIYLYCDFINKAATWSCSAQAEINIISNKSNAVHLLKKVEHIFKSTDKNRGSIIPMEKILDPTNGYVKNDTITIELNLVACEPTGI